MSFRTDILSQQARKQINSKGDAVYQCDTCSRKIRVPANKQSFEVIQRCIITNNCFGKLHKVLTKSESNSVSAIPPAVNGLTDWTQRRVFYSHTQPVENNVWTIVHNLANSPSVQTFITVIVDGEDELVEILPNSVKVIDLNTVTVTFDRPYKGMAQCLATSSVNRVNERSIQPATVTTSDTFVLTNNGEITIATDDSAPLINLTLSFQTGDNTVDLDYLAIGVQTNLNSPWTGVSRIYHSGKLFSVRSFNIRTDSTTPEVFATNAILNGSRFHFSSFSSVVSRNLILLGTSPFAPIDRIYNRYVDIASVSPTQPQLFYTNGEAQTASSIIKSVYPQIFIVD